MRVANGLVRFFVLAFAFTLLAATVASADTMFVTLDTANLAVSPYPGPYVSVSVNRTSNTDATITFTSLNSPGGTYTYAIGSTDMAGVNVNAASFTVGSITENGAGTPSNNGAGNINGFGDFNLTIKNTAGFGDRSTIVSFLLTNTSGTWLTAPDVLVANSNGALAGAHIFVSDGPALGNPCGYGACATGYAAGNNGTEPPIDVHTPEPSSIVLLGSGLVAFAVWSRKRVK